jgi:hypothetical protein
MARENAMTSAIGIGDPGSRPEYSTMFRPEPKQLMPFVE